MSENVIGITGRIIANAYYVFQGDRIKFMNQFRDLLRKKIEDIGYKEVEKKKDKKTREKKYTDTVLWGKWKQVYIDGKISEDEYNYINKCWTMIKETKKLEDMYQKAMGEYVSKEPVFMNYLDKVRGIGIVLSANLLKEYGDCSQYDNVSKLWAHSGYGVDTDGKAPKRKKGEEITYSPRLKMLGWKISDNLMKSNHGYYRQIYDSEKAKQLNRKHKVGELFEKYGKPYTKEDIHLSKLHAHNRAKRKVTKHFLGHYWEVSRQLSGLPAVKIYVEGVLEHDHIVSWKEAIQKEGTVKKAIENLEPN